MSGREDIGRAQVAGMADPQVQSATRELLWLNRRRELLLRAISEMEQNEATPEMRLELVSNVPELLGWARRELERIEARIAQIARH